MSATNPLTVQVAGNHYKKLAIQPMVFATINNYDPCAYSILKYVTRWRDKGGVQDLKKALHVAHMRQAPEIREELCLRRVTHVGMAEYVRVNQIPEPDASILMRLERWFVSSRLSNEQGFANSVVEGLTNLIAQQERSKNG